MGGSSLIVMGLIKVQLIYQDVGGLLRNNYDICVSSFARKIGSCDALHAEMWGMYIEMDLARRQGITHLQVESDSKVLVDMVTGNCKVDQTHSRSQDLGLASPD
ncbi:TMV resistance protein N [Trifolium repens]|nr:TMV resistance protein N [Trifolium repens]